MAPASTSPLGSCVDASAVAASQDGPEDSTSSMSPPPTAFVLFARLCPPPTIVCPWPRQRRRYGIPAVIRFEVFIVVVVVVVIILGLDILCCGHRHLSRWAAASIATPPPLLLRQCLSHCASLVPAVGCCIVISLAAPVPLLSCRRLSCRCGASLVAPHLRRLVVASPTILTCRHLSCRAGWLLPCYLSLCATVSLFATSLIALPSL